MDVFAQNPEAAPLLQHLGRAVALAAPADWPVAELEVRVTESAAGIARNLRILSPRPPGQAAAVPDHVRELAAELERMYEGIGQRWALFALTVTRSRDGLRLNTYSEFRR
jgi:hypothetical protein